MPTHKATAYIALGANLGQAKQAVLQAIAALGHLPQTALLARSSLYYSAPVDATGPDFINAVVCLETSLDAHALLKQLQQLETMAGRERAFFNAPRTLDLDILLYADATVHSAALQIPHPRMAERAFVLLPLAEIAPQLVSAAQLRGVAGQAISVIGD